jgi:hypothetical protein
MNPTLALALEDFVPVLLTLLALSWLSSIVFQIHRPSGTIAVLGLILVVSGGFFKAAGKLIWVVYGERIAWMDESLFILMAPGFACLAWAIWSGQKLLLRDVEPRLVWQMPLILLLFTSGGTVLAQGRNQGSTWFIVLLTLVVLMSGVMLILLSRHALFYRRKGIAFLFILYLAFNLVLNGLARTPSPTVGVEWTKQLLNTAATAILAFASWRLRSVTRRKFDIDLS